MSIPYASATSGHRALQEVQKILRNFGCEKVGIMDDLKKHEVLLHFEHRGRAVQLPVSAMRWAQAWLKENPWSPRSRKSEQEYREAALRQGHLAVSSALRDWVKGQVTANECGIMSFEALFMSSMLTADGRRLVECLPETGLLPKPDEKIVRLQPSSAGVAGTKP